MVSRILNPRVWLILVVAAVAQSATAAWVPGDCPVTSSSSPAVMQWSESGSVLEFDLAGFDLEPVIVDGRYCVRIGLPGHALRREAGRPELPLVTRSLVVGNRGRVSLHVREHVVREMPVAPVVPSRGHLLRNVDPTSIPRTFGAVYTAGGIWPAAPAQLGRPFILRDHRGVTVTINPIRYDAGRGVLLISERLVLGVITGGEPGVNELLAPGPSTGQAAFATVYNELFPDGGTDVAADKYQAPASRGRMLIVADVALTGAMAPFVAWKQQNGIDVELISTAAVGGTTAGIDHAIAARYNDAEGLTWVILVGDKAQVPTHRGAVDGCDSDIIYALQAGADLYPDLYISRISATNSVEVATQINKFISYERTPATGQTADWYQQAAGIASDEGSPTDFERAELLRTDLLAYGFDDVQRIYQGLGGSRPAIAAAVNDGCSLINYLGHGTGTGWTSVPFSVTDVAGLANTGRWPWIVDVSCSNGDFGLPVCFAEAWLRAGTPAVPAGAVAMMSATSDAPWVPPTVMQAEVVDLLTRNDENRIGALYYAGLMKVLDVYGDLSVGRLVVEQNVVFGDCSLMVRSKTPAPLLVAHDAVIDPAAVSFAVDVDLPGAVVALTTAGELYGTGIADHDGACIVPLVNSVANLSTLTLTVTGYNRIPYQIDLNLGSPSTDIEDDETPTAVQLVGNYPNPFNPSTRVVYTLPSAGHIQLAVYDLRGRLQRVLDSGQRTAGRHEVLWDGRNHAGRSAPSGVYLCRLVTDLAPMQVRRMVLAR